MGFHTAVDFGQNCRRFRDFSVQCRLFPFENKTFADAIDRVHMHVQPFSDFPAGQTHSFGAGIAPQQHVCVTNLLSRSVPIASNRFQPIALLGRQAHNILLRNGTSIRYRNCHPWHS